MPMYQLEGEEVGNFKDLSPGEGGGWRLTTILSQECLDATDDDRRKRTACGILLDASGICSIHLVWPVWVACKTIHELLVTSAQAACIVR